MEKRGPDTDMGDRIRYVWNGNGLEWKCQVSELITHEMLRKVKDMMGEYGLRDDVESQGVVRICLEGYGVARSGVNGQLECEPRCVL